MPTLPPHAGEARQDGTARRFDGSPIHGSEGTQLKSGPRDPGSPRRDNRTALISLGIQKLVQQRRTPCSLP
jgi:hypothetical protein